MQNFTNNRYINTTDEIWLVEHFPVFTQGRTGKSEHILIPSSIPIVKSDRGGQITYHGPGQQIMYVLLNLKKRKLGVRKLITLLENTVISVLKKYVIPSRIVVGSPGVYSGTRKICSIGLRIHKGCSLHGIALNVNMDLSPFLYINPCGFPGMKMTQMSYWHKDINIKVVRKELVKYFFTLLNDIKVD